jgi:predicted DNA-binding transcriptional regulator AlpA
MSAEPQLLSRLETAARLKISEATFERLRRAAPDFPKPIRMLKGTIRFVESEVDEFIARRMAERDGAKAA